MNSDLRTVLSGVPHGSVLDSLFVLLYTYYLYRFVGSNNVRLQADDTATIKKYHDLNFAQEQAKELFTKPFCWCIAIKLSIDSKKTTFVLFHENTPVPKNCTCITIELMQVQSVKSVE